MIRVDADQQKRGVAISATSKKSLFVWTCLILGQTGLGGALYLFLPPEPLWRVDKVVIVPERPLFFRWQAATPEGPWSAVLHDMRTGQPIRTFFADTKEHGWLSFSPGGDWVTCVHGSTLRIGSLADGSERTISFGPGESIQTHLVSPDGSLAAVDLILHGLDACRTVLIEIDTGKRIAEAPGLINGGAEFTRDGSLFVANLADGDDCVLKAWDTRKRAWVFQLDSTRTPKRLDHAVSPDGRTLVDKFRNEAGEPCWAVWDLREFTCAIAGPRGTKLDKWCFSGDGRRLALVHGKRNAWHLDVWDVDARRTILQLDSAWRADVVFSPDGKRLALQTYEGGDDAVKCLSLLDVDSGRRLWEKRDWQHMFWVEPAPKFGPGGRSVVVYPGWRQALCAEILDTETGTLLASLPIAADGLWSDATVTVSPDLRSHSVVVQPTPPAAASWREWLPQMLQPSDDNFTELHVIDVEPPKVRCRMDLREGEKREVLDGGRLLVTEVPDDANGAKPGHVCCWEVPAGTAWRWVIGIPAALGGLVAAAVLVCRRRRITFRSAWLQ